MMRQKTCLTILCAALAVSFGAGCSFSMRAGSNTAENEKPEPAPEPEPTTEPAPEPTPAPKPAEEPVVDQKTGRIVVPGNIVFASGKADLQEGSGSEETLAKLKTLLDKQPRITRMRIEGHTDNVDDDDFNLELSGKRALTIKTWLTTNGVAKERVLAVGCGETRPIVDNSTDEGRAQNRRTEFRIAELDGKRFLGRPADGGCKVFE